MTGNINAILSRFPKTRPSLDKGQAEIYQKEYLDNRSGEDLMSSLAQKLESWMHKNVTKNTRGKKLLEIGAGTLNHIPYIDTGNIELIDVIEPMESLYQNDRKKLIRNFFSSMSECSEKYDTIYSIACLEHICDLPDVIAKAGSLLEPEGRFINAIPCEGGFLWGLSWRCSTGLSYKLRTGFSYKTLMRHEHVNNHDEIIALIKYFFKDVKISYFPIYGKQVSLYACISARSPNMDICNDILNKKPGMNRVFQN